jgi:LytS/YehU family sensor histidine kinase
LLKGKLLQFIFFTLGWAAAGIYIDVGYRGYILIPLQEAMKLNNILPRGPIPFCYLCMTTSAASPMIIKFFKLWKNKQQDWLQARREKVTAEMELLKKQIHPHFLFNTLNNIYSFSLTNSPQTPGLILKLSSLLNYMLYDCKTEEVELEKEIEVMKNYVDLEKERYGNVLELHWNVEGKIKNKKIAPLLMLPFLENAFKHGVSEQIERPMLSVNICIVNHVLQCTISNSKNTYIKQSHRGIGIDNVKKRLEFIYSSRYELAIRDEGSIFTVVMQLRLMNELSDYTIISAQPFMNQAVSA